MKKNYVAIDILVLLLLISTFLTHSGHGNAATLSTHQENYWQLVLTSTYFLPFLLLVILLLLALFLQVKQAG
ncbi:hypothetical protein DLJ48_02290 [Oenococcus sicerae]|uniref:Uncharacterized protein n=1 Tax=Oenococcus sicerae TaxID=2203724 RepID=A0AAJ1RER1_9LACO|nr:hypothetical protein [Oenococcus sicerae]MDN6900551.1 hypothetical protein [Oenococcus sicerae]QAS69432.1 hypothetical protein DLJ48_02290 [Oenococcus sicerae]